MRSRILCRIRGKEAGWVFTPNHPLDLGTRANVGMALKWPLERVDQAIPTVTYPRVIRRVGKSPHYRQLVQRALTHLPVGRKTVTRVPEGDVLAECAASAMATAVQRAWPEEMLERDLELAREYEVRIIANTVTLLSWRNGPVEDVHAGWRPGHRFNERRVLPLHEKAIIRHAQNVLHAALNAMEHMVLDGAWPPPPKRTLPFMRPFCHPRDWSYTQQSLEIDLPLNDN